MNRAIEERRRLGSGVGFAVALLVGAAASLPAQVLDDSASRERRAIQAAQQLERAGRPNEAVAVLETLLTDQPASVAGLVLMSQLVQDRGEPERVLPWVERAAQWDGEGLPVVRQVWVRGLVAAGWTDSARSVARAWTEATPNEPMAWVGRALGAGGGCGLDRRCDRSARAGQEGHRIRSILRAGTGQAVCDGGALWGSGERMGRHAGVG